MNFSVDEWVLEVTHPLDEWLKILNETPEDTLRHILGLLLAIFEIYQFMMTPGLLSRSTFQKKINRPLQNIKDILIMLYQNHNIMI